jgi:hypothetical protein
MAQATVETGMISSYRPGTSGGFQGRPCCARFSILPPSWQAIAQANQS